MKKGISRLLLFLLTLIGATKPLFTYVTPGQTQIFTPVGTGFISENYPVANWFDGIVGLPNRPKIIYFYQTGKPYYEFANFWQAQIRVGGETFTTSEHYFQAQKFINNQTIYDLVKNQPTAKKAFDAGRASVNHIQPFWRTDISNSWGGIGLRVMLTGLVAKFGQNQQLRDILLETGNAIIVENAGRNDNFYGAGEDGTGQNHLGRMLMFLRHVEVFMGKGCLQNLASSLAQLPKGTLIDPSYCQGYDNYNPIAPAVPVMAFQRSTQPQRPQIYTVSVSDSTASPGPAPVPVSVPQLHAYNQGVADNELFGELYKKLYGLLNKVRMLATKLDAVKGMLSRLKDSLQMLAHSVMGTKLPAPSAVDEVVRFKLLTCNVLHQGPYAGYGQSSVKLTEQERKDSFVKILDRPGYILPSNTVTEMADVMCFQEFAPSWHSLIPKKFEIVSPSDSYVCVCYDKSKFSKVGVNQGLMTGGRHPYNYYQAVLLEHIASKKKIAVLTCHYQGRGADRFAQSSKVIEVMNSSPFSDADVQVVCGDFNTRPKDPSLNDFFTNGWHEVRLGTTNNYPQQGAFTARHVRGIATPDYIDYVWYRHKDPALRLVKNVPLFPHYLTQLIPHASGDNEMARLPDGTFYFSDHIITYVGFVLKKTLKK